MGWVRRKNNIHIEDLDIETLEEVMAYVGKNKDTYRKKWGKFNYGKKGLNFLGIGLHLSLDFFGLHIEK